MAEGLGLAGLGPTGEESLTHVPSDDLVFHMGHTLPLVQPVTAPGGPSIQARLRPLAVTESRPSPTEPGGGGRNPSYRAASHHGDTPVTGGTKRGCGEGHP